ncbi:protein Shroom3 [Pontoporia blainvillei]|uniref:Protein Shroom3 n=1 Tax=Pontoporia blainvillei TaxID=48723 RepID=A0ABX0S8M7_PONBL|nr:protein Shroom3 [Pontoporia blainvillei]
MDPPRQTSRTPCPRPVPSGAQGHLPDTRAAPPSSALPAPGPSSYCSQAATAQPCTPAGPPRNGGHWPAQPPSPERRKEEGAGTRPSPPWVKGAHAVREDSFPEDGASPGCASPKHYPEPQALPSLSSTSDPDTPLGAPGTLGRVSLRISGSAPLASLLPQEDDHEMREDDEEVFVRDLRSTATSGPACEAPPPPSREAVAQNQDRFPPPPPEAVCAEQWDSEGYRDPHASSSGTLAKVTVAKERPIPGAAHLVDSQILASRSQTSIKSSEANETNPPSSTGALPQPAGSLSKQPSPGQPPCIQTQSLSHNPVSGTQSLEKNAISGPQKTSEDMRTEALAKEIVHQDKSLADILDPDYRMKTTMDLMEGLFPRDADLLKENSIKRKAMQRTVSFPGCEAKR